MIQQRKATLAMPAWMCIPAALFSANGLEKAAKDGQSAWALAPTGETQTKIQFAGFNLAQCRKWQLCGERINP